MLDLGEYQGSRPAGAAAIGEEIRASSASIRYRHLFPMDHRGGKPGHRRHAFPGPVACGAEWGINDTNGAASQEVARSSAGGFHAEGHLGAVGAPLVRSVGRPSLASALRDPARGGILA